jgi:allantoin racemase
MRIHIINPNTTALFTDGCREAGRAVAAPGSDIVATNPISGPPTAESHLDEAIATIGIVQEVAAGERNGADAFVIACFGDAGLDAAREVGDRPVVGMSEAAVYMAALVAPRFSIVTLPSRTRAQSERVLHHAGLAHRCTVRAIDVGVADCAEDGAAVYEALLLESRRALAEDHAEAIILGCAGLEKMAAPLSRALSVPVIEGVAAGVKMAEALVSLGLMTSKTGAWGPPPASSLRASGVPA